MNMIIVSDSHGLTEELTLIQSRHLNAELFIHCGDSELAEAHPSLKNYEVVRGNCDSEKQFPNELLLEASGEKLFVTHGHLHSVKSSLMALTYRAEELGATICCFGHSHLVGVEKIGQILFINPGSIRLPRGRKEKTYVHLTKVNEQYVITIYSIDGTAIQQLTI